MNDPRDTHHESKSFHSSTSLAGKKRGKKARGKVAGKLFSGRRSEEIRVRKFVDRGEGEEGGEMRDADGV